MGDANEADEVPEVFPDPDEDIVGFMRYFDYPLPHEVYTGEQSVRARPLQAGLLALALEQLEPEREYRSDYYKLPRNYNWFYTCVKSVEGDDQYRRYFRVTRSTFEYLVSLIQDNPIISRDHSKRHDYLTAEEQLALALRYAATGDSYESVGGLCGASRSSVHNAVVCVSSALYQHAHAWIHFPRSVDEAQSIASEFQHLGSWQGRRRGGASTPGIPQAVGAMDGTQVLLAKKPDHSGDAYINRKFYPALNVHGVVDVHMRFMDVFVGCAGRSHDASVLDQSPLGGQLADPSSHVSRLLEAGKKSIFGVEVPLQLLGDPAYPLRRFVLPAFKDSQASQSGPRARFNDKHRSARNVVERAFGSLKMRWRCMWKGAEVSVITTTWVIVMCFMLHNVCIAMNDLYQHSEEEFEEMASTYERYIEQTSAGRSEMSASDCEVFRDVLVSYVNTIQD